MIGAAIRGWMRPGAVRRILGCHSFDCGIRRAATTDQLGCPAHRDRGQVRLNKRMSELGLCSRLEADKYIAAGLVTVDGVVVSTLGSKVGEATRCQRSRPVLTQSILCLCTAGQHCRRAGVPTAVCELRTPRRRKPAVQAHGLAAQATRIHQWAASIAAPASRRPAAVAG
jgi:hypothetical protein